MLSSQEGVLRGINLQIINKLLTNSMKQSPSSQAYSHSATEEVSRLLWNLNVHCRVHNIPPLVLPWARWIQSTPSRAIYLISILQVMMTYFFWHCLNALFSLY